MLLALPRLAKAGAFVAFAVTLVLAIYFISAPRYLGEPDYSKQGWVDLPIDWPKPMTLSPSDLPPPPYIEDWVPRTWQTTTTTSAARAAHTSSDPTTTGTASNAVVGAETSERSSSSETSITSGTSLAAEALTSGSSQTWETSITAGTSKLPEDLTSTGTTDAADATITSGTSRLPETSVTMELTSEPPTFITSSSSSLPSTSGTISTTNVASHPLNSPSSLNVISSDDDASDNFTDAPCQSLAGGADVVVVMRTGATEIRDKIPVHLNTTFQCYPNSIIFSDYAEAFQTHEVYDVLRDIDEDIKNSNSDFDHYQHVLEVGRLGLDESELSGQESTGSGPIGNNDNAGWRLDKWKFLPMINRTLELHPDKKWYVFLEADSYMVWSNLLQWLQKLNFEKPLYYGSQVQIGEDIFAHGGSVFLLSHPAMVKGVEEYTSHREKWHDWTAGHWAGDCVLGRVLHEAGVELTWSHPMFQGGNPFLLDFSQDMDTDVPLWCSPAISYHHLSPDEVAEMWDFEQEWIGAMQNTSPDFRGRVLHHHDVFSRLVKPRLASDRPDWNNDLDYEREYLQEAASFDQCREVCEGIQDCLQFSLRPDGCAVSAQPRFGRAEEGIRSGWMTHRIEKWERRLGDCQGKDGWLRIDQRR